METVKNGLITIVIPNYNGMRYIAECLDSVLSGTIIPHIIVVDNASTDGSRELVEENYPMVTLLKLHANTGFCHAVNCGLHLVRTRYAILLNNDIRADRRFVEELYSAIAQDERVFSVQARMLSMKDPEKIDSAGDFYCALGWAFSRGKGKRKDAYNRPGEIFSSCAGAAIYRMKAFEKIGWFDERHFCYLEDVDVGYRAQIYGYRNLYAPRAVVYHAGSASSGSAHNAFKEGLVPGNNDYLLYKNMPAAQYVLNAPLIGLGKLVKRAYFKKKGLGEAYSRGLARGTVLKALAMEADELRRYGESAQKGTILVEAALSMEDTDPSGKDKAEGKTPGKKLSEIYPLYLGGKVPFEAGHLKNYARIQLRLWENCFRRLVQ